MKKFLIQAFIFFLLAIIAMVATVFITNTVIREKAGFRLQEGIDKIVIGHSHPECAYNDSLISGLKNFSHSGESYFYTYHKILPLLKANPGIKTVFIEFTNNYFEDPDNLLIWGSRYINYQYPRNAAFFDASSNLLLFSHNPKTFLNVQSLVAKDNLLMILSNNYEHSRITGSYIYLVRDKTDSLLAAGKDKIKTKFVVSDLAMEYLRKLVDYCKRTGRQVYFIRTPLHPRNPGLKHEALFQETRKKLFSDVEFFDFVSFPLENSEFGDLEHLNYRGAKKFSLYFNSWLQTHF
jgi:hypothetical protein